MIPIAKPILGDREIRQVTTVLKSGFLGQGKKVAEFEEQYARYIGSEYAIATVNGTSALHVALLASGIGPGDEVITTPFSFIASANAILYCGAKPVFVDIDPKTYLIDLEKIPAAVTKKTKAIVVVHLYGQPCDMDHLRKLCDEYGLVLMEDACQAHGAEYRGQRVGSFGVGCFSFYATKNMTTGEGGMITTNEDDVARRSRMMRDHGQIAKYTHIVWGHNFRMTDIVAAIGIEQLKQLDEWNARRVKNAKLLTAGLQSVVGTPFVSQEVEHVFHQYVVRSEQRDAIQAYLSERGVGTAIHYPMMIPQQDYYRSHGFNPHFPEAERATKQVLSLPVHPSVTSEEVRYIISTLRGYFEK